MSYAEKRGKLWRARWRGPEGTLESKPGFRTRKDAENYGRDQEAAEQLSRPVDRTFHAVVRRTGGACSAITLVRHSGLSLAVLVLGGPVGSVPLDG